MSGVLDLSVVVTDAAGVGTRWGSEDADAATVPQGISFSTQRMQGFADATLTLRRRIDMDYVDLHLLDDIAFIGGDGSVAYEGRVAAMPRSFDTGHSVTLQLVGWMAHARDRKFTEIYVDRDLSRWTGASQARRLALANGTRNYWEPEVLPGSVTGTIALRTKIVGPFSAASASEAIYDARPNKIGGIYYQYAGNTNVNGADANWLFQVFFSPDDVFSTGGGTGDLQASSGSAGSGFIANPTPATWPIALIQQTYSAASASTTEFSLDWTNVTVYGAHGLGLYGGAPQGLRLSDILTNIATRFCPKLNPAGIAENVYVVPHMVFVERTDPYDAFLALNAYSLWNLAVWENKTLWYTPPDLTDYDWEVRISDPGVTMQLQGDSTENLANGIVVQFTNVATGHTDTLTPDIYADLRDDSVENPANQHGYPLWPEYQLSIPATTDSALQIGRVALAEFNQPKAPGTITVSHFIKDRAGHSQPVWKVRAGDTISITDHPNDRPRMISETSYDHDSKTLTISLEAPAKRLDAVVDRIATALKANNLS